MLKISEIFEFSNDHWSFLNFERILSLRQPLEGAVVASVNPGSPAEAAGIQPLTRTAYGGTVLGDVITAVGATPVRQNEDLICAVEEAEPGRPLEITIARGGDPRRVERVLVTPLVERFDVEPFSDFSAKWANFIGLVLCCIDAKFCNKIFVGKLLTRSTRFTCFCTAQTSIFQKIFVKFFRIFGKI